MKLIIDFPQNSPSVQFLRELTALTDKNNLMLSSYEPGVMRFIERETPPNNVVALRRPARIMPFNNHPGPGAA